MNDDLNEGQVGVLQGRQILLFAGSALQPLRGRLSALGATVELAHADTEATDARTIERFIDDLVVGEYDDVLFSTAHGVRLICEYAEQIGVLKGLVGALHAVRLIARGRRTEAALAEVGLESALVVSDQDVRALSALVDNASLSGRIVGVQAATPSDAESVGDLLRAAGARVRVLSQSPEPDGYAEALLERILSGKVDSIAFGSSHQLRWLESEATAQGRREALYAALGGVTLIAVEAAAALLRDRGLSPRLIPARRLSGPWEEHELRRLFSPNRPANDSVAARPGAARRVVVIGNGMVGHRFCDRLSELDKDGAFQVTVFGEEPRVAYDRVHLTSYFEHRDPAVLSLATNDWYARRKIVLRSGERVVAIDRRRRLVESSTGDQLAYDYLVFATGSEPFVPPISGTEKAGVFVYRTIEDLDALIAYSASVRTAAVVGGGLLGLEAAKAVRDLGLETHVVECAARLMPRQLDAPGARLLRRRVEALGVHVHLEKTLTRILGESKATGLRFADGSRLETDVIVISAGIRPRDELAREAELAVGARGGIVVDDTLCTSDRRVFAIGECAFHRGTVYGLVGPGYEMADVLASILTGSEAVFRGADTSTKLKLLGVDVASFGDPFADEKDGQSVVLQDLVSGVYKKLVVDETGERLLGGVLVGDASQYASLWNLARNKGKLPASTESLLVGAGAGAGALELTNDAQICSCNNVSKQTICEVIRDKSLTTVGEIKGCTRAGTGCGGCLPLLNDILTAELRAAGQVVKQRLCEHFEFTRAELFEIVRVKKIRTFEALLSSYGRGNGCEVCKPTVASIFASVFNDLIVEYDTLQDTNDRFLANLQRGGLYSVVPRVPGGEITPEKLIKLGEVAQRYGLYTKITGGQRVDLFGAKLDDLPEIWEALVEAGFESGHAYGKAMRTVKSCVGSTWCRFGVRDSVGFAVRVEQRYKGIRAPHKLKSAVSGCIRECAEAQSKDFGLIATEKGWNVYVCGNGGAKPRHADLLVADVDEDTAIRMLDRFIMFYIRTADRLTRTSVWLEKMDGGIQHLRDVIVHDSLDLCEQLEADMQNLVDTYRCEWTEVVRDPIKRAKFRHFANGRADDGVEFVHERGQRRPRDWPLPVATERAATPVATEWFAVGRAEDFPRNGGIAVRHGDRQVAVFNFSSRGQWYATDNRCPHMNEQLLARGIIGDQDDIPKVACPVHKKTFSLEDGRCLSDQDQCGVETYSVKVENGTVFVRMPVIATSLVPPSRLNRSKERAVALARR